MSFKKGNKLWDNPKSRKMQFPKGHISKPWLGKKLSENHKKNISKIAKKKGFGRWMRGKRNSSETEFKKGIIPKTAKKKGCIPWNKSKKMPQYSGKKHWNWRGGVTSINQNIRQSIEYKLWRKAVFERDNYTCKFCGERGGKIHADHIKPFALFPELRFAIDNGRTLCKECHKTTETYLQRRKI